MKQALSAWNNEALDLSWEPIVVGKCFYLGGGGGSLARGNGCCRLAGGGTIEQHSAFTDDTVGAAASGSVARWRGGGVTRRPGLC